MKIRTYQELSQLETFQERFEYLKLKGVLGDITFGFDRWVNQRFYKSVQWNQVRTQIIVRDNGCDLGIPGYEIYAGYLVHHMNPMRLSDLIHGEGWVIDPNYLILTSLATHNAIHYGDPRFLPRGPIERKPGDTTLW
jgi:hypothetical protein